MTYRVRLEKTDEGYAVWCPGLPGCVSEGNDEQEALENIRVAILEYLAVAEELSAVLAEANTAITKWGKSKVRSVNSLIKASISWAFKVLPKSLITSYKWPISRSCLSMREFSFLSFSTTLLNSVNSDFFLS